jgi:IclR family transcriptional regulator, acetate operon repressor
MARREWQSDLGIFQNEIAEVTRVLPTTVNKATLATDLSHARSRIFRQSGEVVVGAIAIAEPYSDHGGRVAGSVGVFGPAARLDERRIVKTVSSS